MAMYAIYTECRPTIADMIEESNGIDTDIDENISNHTKHLQLIV